jgi:hypothetical protein
VGGIHSTGSNRTTLHKATTRAERATSLRDFGKMGSSKGKQLTAHTTYSCMYTPKPPLCETPLWITTLENKAAHVMLVK